MMSALDNIANELKEVLSEEALRLLVGSVELKKIMDEMQDLQDKLDSAKSNYKSIKDELDEKEAERTKGLQTIKNLNDKINKYKEREEEISKNEFEHRVRNEVIKYEVRRGDEFHVLLGSALRNTTIRKTMLGTENVPIGETTEIKDQYGNIQTYGSPSHSMSEEYRKDTTETEE